MVLKMPPTRIGRHVIGAPNSAASGWMLWNARYVHGLEQSKKNSIIGAALPFSHLSTPWGRLSVPDRRSLVLPGRFLFQLRGEPEEGRLVGVAGGEHHAD